MKNLQDIPNDSNKGDELLIEVTDFKETFNVTTGLCFFNSTVKKCNVDVNIPYTENNLITIGLKELDYKPEWNDEGSMNI